MRYLVCHRGIPIGSIEAELAELLFIDLEISPAYESIRESVRESSEEAWSEGFENPRVRVTVEALVGAKALPFELRTLEGRLVDADLVAVIARKDPARVPVVLIRTQRAAAGVVSQLPQRDRPARGP